MTKHAKASEPSVDRKPENGSRGLSANEHESGASGGHEGMAALQAAGKLYYRIGEVSKLTGVKAHVLRYWETEFRWMAPPKSRSKQRLYRQRDIEFVWLLKRLLWDERYTIAGARQRIQELGVEDALALLQIPAESHAKKTSTQAMDWTPFRTTLEEMERDLVALRGVLQESP